MAAVLSYECFMVALELWLNVKDTLLLFKEIICRTECHIPWNMYSM